MTDSWYNSLIKYFDSFFEKESETEPEPVSISPMIFGYPFNAADEIESGLFLGSYDAALNKAELVKKGITRIVSIANELGSPPYPNDFAYTVVGIDDLPEVNISRHFETCFHAIDEGKDNGGVLVHCRAGMSRSATVVIAYMMKTHGLSMKDAFAHVKQRRPIICPNRGFLNQLQEYEFKLAGFSSSNASSS